MMRFLAIIPARSGSKGIPRKNIIDLAGRPLISYAIESALACARIDDLIVSTDSSEIASVAKSYGANVPFLRPAHLATDKSDTAGVLVHAVKFMESQNSCRYSAIILLQPTTPFRSSSLIDRCILRYLQTDCDSLTTVVDVGANHPYRMYTSAENHFLVPLLAGDHDATQARQTLPKVLIRSGDVYITSRDLLVNHGQILGEKLIGVEIDPLDAVNIDTLTDLELARLRIQAKHQDP